MRHYVNQAIIDPAIQKPQGAGAEDQVSE